MKKLNAVLLAVMMILTCSLCGSAEELAVPDPQIQLPEIVSMIPKGQKAASDTSSSDLVSVDGDRIIIETEQFKFTLTLPESYDCFTQDLSASFSTYLTYGMSLENANELIQWMNENKVHLLVVDPFMNEIQIRELGTDSVSQLVGNLNNWSEANVNAVGQKLADSFKCSYTGIVKTDMNTWIGLDSDWLITIVNSSYILAMANYENPLEDEIECFQTLVSALSVE